MRLVRLVPTVVAVAQQHWDRYSMASVRLVPLLPTVRLREQNSKLGMAGALMIPRKGEG